MRITLELYARLTEYPPADARTGNRMTLDIAPHATITEIVAPLNLRPKPGAPGADPWRGRAAGTALDAHAGRGRRAGDPAAGGWRVM